MYQFISTITLLFKEGIFLQKNVAILKKLLVKPYDPPTDREMENFYLNWKVKHYFF